MIILNFLLKVYSANFGFIQFKDQILHQNLIAIKNQVNYQIQTLEITKNYDEFYFLLKNTSTNSSNLLHKNHYKELFEINENTILEYILYMIFKCNKNDAEHVYDLYSDFLTVRIALFDKQRMLLKNKEYAYTNLKSDSSLNEHKKEFERLKLELCQNNIIQDIYDIKSDFVLTIKNVSDEYSDLFNAGHFTGSKELYASYVEFLSSILLSNELLLNRFYNQLKFA